MADRDIKDYLSDVEIVINSEKELWENAIRIERLYGRDSVLAIAAYDGWGAVYELKNDIFNNAPDSISGYVRHLEHKLWKKAINAEIKYGNVNAYVQTAINKWSAINDILKALDKNDVGRR